MKSKTLWIARNRSGGWIRIFKSKPTLSKESNNWVARGDYTAGFCPREFLRATGIRFKMGEGPYELTLTVKGKKDAPRR